MLWPVFSTPGTVNTANDVLVRMKMNTTVTRLQIAAATDIHNMSSLASYCAKRCAVSHLVTLGKHYQCFLITHGN